ncbi:E3 SUMO-protein ligase PIAS1 [Entomortierella parvispora]|uniref:E3 SUMO-protein ligase PIAS1 n=1 Tax=Entomortierella parvispora TaxID=205924 RepID=A0A9P3LUM4_9FUNG|nr:E3 SUMO-protein ligase PIAS1 [Entomortierella parvispora]
MEDYQTIVGRIIPSLLVTQLKTLIKNLNETIRPAPQLKIGGNKQDLIDRLTTFISQYNLIGDQVVIRQIRHCIAEFNQGQTSTILTSALASSQQPFDGYRTGAGSNMLTSKPGHGSGSGQQHGVHRSHQAHQTQQQVHLAAQSNLIRASNPNLVFKSSPFYKDVQTLTPPRLCAEAKDRTLSTSLAFTIPPLLASHLQSDPNFQLMVFCGWADGAINTPALMEFPHVCEIKVNGRVLEANLRGMKNKPGTVSPANITKYCKLTAGEFNKVEFIYANSTKRYYVSTHLVKKTPVEAIVAEIERGKFLSKETMLKMIEDRNKDDDIMATSSTLSLKCPLGFQRITLPCRSSYCQHLQCFDAFTYFNLNEQTPTWTCPVCNRIMHSWEEIVVDGYFKDILNSTPKSLESVTVRADGQWEIPSTETAEVAVKPSLQKKASESSSSDVFVLDDDSDDEAAPQAKSAPAAAPPAPPKPSKPVIEVIDLISDSEDEVEETRPGSIDADGDTSMQDAANSLQNMAHSGLTTPQSVKTEFVDKTTSSGAETPFAPTPAGVQSLIGSTNASPAASSDDSPVISNRMVQTEPGLPASVAPATSTTPVAWDSTQESFLNDLLNPRRKRQYEAVDDDNRDNIQDARQRISRLDLRSNTSSERGQSSLPSPENARTSTSSPTNADQQGDQEGSTSRRERDPHHPVYYETVATGATTAPFAEQLATSRAPSLPLAGSRHTTPRGVTMSPPHPHSYGNGSPHHGVHHIQHRSTASPNPHSNPEYQDYYVNRSRPGSSSSGHASMPVPQRSNSIGSRPSSASGSWSAPEPRLNGSGERWTSSRPPSGIHGNNGGSGNAQLNHGSSPQRPNHSDEYGSSSSAGGSSQAYYSSRSRSPGSCADRGDRHNYDYGYGDRRSVSSGGGHSIEDYRNRSAEEYGKYDRRDGHGEGYRGVPTSVGGGGGIPSSHHHHHHHHHQPPQQHPAGFSASSGGPLPGQHQDRVYHSRSLSSSSGVVDGHSPNVYNPALSPGGAGSRGDSGGSSGREEDAPIFNQGLRGAGARAR